MQRSINRKKLIKEGMSWTGEGSERRLVKGEVGREVGEDETVEERTITLIVEESSKLVPGIGFILDLL